jgi:hypothetical protein
VAAVRSELAGLVLAQGDAARAASLLTDSEAVLRDVDDHIELAKTLATRAEVDAVLGRHDEARAHLAEASDLQRAAGLHDDSEVGKRVAHARAALAD